MISTLNNHPTIICFLLYYVVIYKNLGFKWKCICTKQGCTQLFWKGVQRKSDIFLDFFYLFDFFLPFLPQNSTFLKICKIHNTILWTIRHICYVCEYDITDHSNHFNKRKSAKIINSTFKLKTTSKSGYIITAYFQPLVP